MPALQWSEAISWDMPSFLAAYALHDSQIESFAVADTFSGDLGLVVQIDWDLHWSPHIPSDFSALAIRFPCAYFVNWARGGLRMSILAEVTSELCTESEREALLSDSRIDIGSFRDPDVLHPAFDMTLAKTNFQCIGGNALTVIHGSGISLLCHDNKGHHFRLPTQ